MVWGLGFRGWGLGFREVHTTYIGIIGFIIITRVGPQPFKGHLVLKLGLIDAFLVTD